MSPIRIDNAVPMPVTPGPIILQSEGGRGVLPGHRDPPDHGDPAGIRWEV